MTERPILFNAPMVRAVLAGTKTQTRRICKAAKLHDSGEDYRDDDGWPLFDASVDGAGDIRIRSPYGVPGDRLWVRETFCDDWADTEGVYFKADGGMHADMVHAGCRWRPSIHMPRALSRITLEVTTGVRVERLQDISEADAIAEGVVRWTGGRWKCAESDGMAHPTAREAFRCLWESISGRGSWDANPWLWVVEFSRV